MQPELVASLVLVERSLLESRVSFSTHLRQEARYPRTRIKEIR